MGVPFLDLNRQYELIKDEVEQAVLEVMRSGAYIEAPAVKTLEEKLREYIGVKHVITCGNGTDALGIALKAAGISQGDEVITTPFSFFATSEAISNVGATPVFVDIDPHTLNMDPSKIEAAITSKTRAILPVHIFGRPADMDPINAIASKYNLAVIEDACQAIGATDKGKKAGALGTLGCFSFYPTKNLGAFGDAGMITTDDDDLADACRAFKAHGAGKFGYKTAVKLGRNVGGEIVTTQAVDKLYDPYKYYNFLIAENSRLDSIQAAILTVKLAKLDEFNAKRKMIAEKYNRSLANIPIELPPMTDSDECNSSWHQYAILCDQKDALIKALADAGIGTGAFYPVPLHLQKAHADEGYAPGSMPIAEHVCSQSICLPIFPELTADEQNQVIDTIVRFYA